MCVLGGGCGEGTCLDSWDGCVSVDVVKGV
jgi:hypothetical protein